MHFINFDNPTGLSIALILSALIVTLVARLPIFSFLDRVEEGRNHRMDAVRGIAVLMVVFFHGICTAFSHLTKSDKWGGWAKLPSNIEHLGFFLGANGVSLFFMLSAWIFFQRDYSTAPQYLRFFLNRLFRIAPMAILLGLLSWLVEAIYYHDEYTPQQIIFTLTEILSAGFYHTSNAVSAGVKWTLNYEWLLYLSLPVFLFLKKKTPAFVTPILLILFCAYFNEYSYPLSYSMCCFAMGFIAYETQSALHLPIRLADCLAALALFLLYGSGIWAHDLVAVSLLGVIFVLIACKANFFGLLQNKGLIRIGEVSYSIYWIHGLVWFTEMRLIPLRNLHGISLLGLFIGTLILLFLISCVTFRWIELPCIEFGRKWSRKVTQ